jgi:phosphoglycerate dehydrogenase-like enzyme
VEIIRPVKPQVLVPWESARESAPSSLSVQVYDGVGSPSGDLNGVELYVMPYARPDALAVIAQLPSLRALQVLTAGYDQVLNLLPPGVELYNGAGLHDASTAEHALALILAAQRSIPQWVGNQQAELWKTEYTRSLADSRVLIIGHGNIGAAIEARLAPFEVSITTVARRPRPEQGVHGIDELAALLPGADIVVLVLPNTPQTQGLIGPAELALLPDDALVVNVGRGPTLDLDALLAQQGRIRAALDVVDPEPLPAGHPLWHAPGVLLTPHVAGGSATFVPRSRRFVAEQLRRWAAVEPLLNKIEPGN